MVLNRLSDGMRRPRRTLNKSVKRKIKNYNDTDTTCKRMSRFTRATRNHVVLVYACRGAQELCTYVRADLLQIRNTDRSRTMRNELPTGETREN